MIRLKVKHEKKLQKMKYFIQYKNEICGSYRRGMTFIKNFVTPIKFIKKLLN